MEWLRHTIAAHSRGRQNSFWRRWLVMWHQYSTIQLLGVEAPSEANPATHCPSWRKFVTAMQEADQRCDRTKPENKLAKLLFPFCCCSLNTCCNVTSWHKLELELMTNVVVYVLVCKHYKTSTTRERRSLPDYSGQRVRVYFAVAAVAGENALKVDW